MSGVQPFRFEPTYPPVKNQLTQKKKETKETAEPILMRELEIPNDAFVGVIVFQC